jgi:hypothetical protein
MYAGIDYDTNSIHIVLIHEGEHSRTRQLELEGEDAFDRAREVREVMPSRGWWDDAGVIAIGLEEQNSANPKMRASVQKLKMIQGAIIACLPRDTLVNPMAGPHWRKTVGLSGNATKEEVREWARTNGYALLASYALSQDCADAFCLARAVEALAEPVHG